MLNEISFNERYPGEGNPVISVKTEKVGDGPAAVAPLLSKTERGNSFSKFIATVLRQAQDGKAAKGARESENLPGYSSRSGLRV